MAAITTCGKIRLSFKCIQLILACVCIGLYANTGLEKGIYHDATLMAITFGGFIIVMGGQILGFCTGERCPKKVDLLYTLVGLALFVASGSVAISRFNALKQYYSHHHTSDHSIDIMASKKIINTGLAMGSIAIINGVFFLLDAVLSYKDVNEYTPHQ